MRSALIRHFRSAQGDYISGGALAESLAVSRTAVWKQIELLRKLGYEIEAAPRRGYRLVGRPDRLFPWEIHGHLETKRLGRHVEYHERISSTNERAKELAVGGCPEGQLVVAEEQTAGKGRLGRSWISPFAEGLFMSLVLRPPVPPREAPKFTLLAAVAVQRAVAELCGLEPVIKWPNDIELAGKKMCGILVELGTEMDAINYVILGIGVNANVDMSRLPADVKERATSIKAELGRPLDRVALLTSILQYIEALYDEVLRSGFGTVVELSRRLSSTLGQRVRVLAPGGAWEGTAVDIADSGALVVRTDARTLVEVHSGEVSIRRSE